MSLDLLPADFDDLVEEAVRTFWRSRGKTSARHTQGGSRDAVIGGKNMDGFI